MKKAASTDRIRIASGAFGSSLRLSRVRATLSSDASGSSSNEVTSWDTPLSLSPTTAPVALVSACKGERRRR